MTSKIIQHSTSDQDSDKELLVTPKKYTRQYIATTFGPMMM